MSKHIVLLAACAAIAGCSYWDNPQPKPKEPETRMVPDQCLRREIFMQCLQSLPAGPAATKYNDWDEVVGSCGNAAYYQSLRQEQHVKPECRP